MTSQQTIEMQETMHILAEYILRQPCTSNREKWLKGQISELLTSNNNVLFYAQRYEDEYEYAGVANPYLVEMLKAYDDSVGG